MSIILFFQYKICYPRRLIFKSMYPNMVFGEYTRLYFILTYLSI
jgi:hypothetical protein